MPLSNMRAPYNDDSTMKRQGKPSWPCPMRGNNGSASPTSLIHPADPICTANKVDCEQCRCHSTCATVCAAAVTAVLPLAAILSLAFVVLPCCPLLSLSLSCCPPPCHPLLLSSRRAAPCCVAQCRHCTSLHRRDPPPHAAFCAAIMLTVSPLRLRFLLV